MALVGAGPGDPDLLTLKAVKRLEAADVVLHDSLVSEEVLALIPLRSELINVGKRCGDLKDRSLQQQEIHELLLVHSRRGRRVVRLKCGDPLLFGRGGEELEFLASHGVPTEVVPGITAALGAAASVQMPLTHRSCANQVRFLVGQSKSKALPDLDWAELAANVGSLTTVFYMGLKSLGSICEKLQGNGAAADTPMMIVESATFSTEKTVSGTVATMLDLAAKSEIGSAGGPVLIMLGPTAAFPQQLAELQEKSSGQPWKRRKMSNAGSADECQ